MNIAVNPCRRPFRSSGSGTHVTRYCFDTDALSVNDQTRPAAAPHTSTGHGIAAEPVHYLDHTDRYRPTTGQGSFALPTVAMSAAHCRWFGPRDAEVAGYLRTEDEDTIRFPVQPDIPQPTGAPAGTAGASGR